MALERMLEIKLPRHVINVDPHIDSRFENLEEKLLFNQGDVG